MINARLSIAPLFCVLLVSAGTRTSAESDVVTLRDGSSLQIVLSITTGPGPFGTPGDGARTEVELRFSRSGRDYEWSRGLVRGEEWVSSPVIVDFVDDKPIVVFPVFRLAACAAYDYPREGLVAERYDGKRWRRVSFKDLPADLRANVPIEGLRVPPFGKPLKDVVLFYSEYDESCAEVHATPNPLRDAASKGMRDFVASTPIMEPVEIPASEISEEVGAALSASMVGKWSKGFVADSCSGLIDHIDALYVENIPEHAADEVRWVAKDGDRIRVRLRQSFTNVNCDAQSVFILSQDFGKPAIVYRHGHDGSFRDAVSVSTTAIRAKHPTGSIQAFVVSHDRLIFLWSNWRACKKANDKDCWAYSVPWGPPASDNARATGAL